MSPSKASPKDNSSSIILPVIYGLIAAIFITGPSFATPAYGGGQWFAQWDLGNIPFDSRGVATNQTATEQATAASGSTIASWIGVTKTVSGQPQWMQAGWWKGAAIGGNCSASTSQMTLYIEYHDASALGCETGGQAVEDTEYDYQVWNDGALGGGAYKWRASINGVEEFSYIALDFNSGYTSAGLEVNNDSSNTGYGDLNSLKYKPECSCSWTLWPSRSVFCTDETLYYTNLIVSFDSLDVTDGSGDCD